MNTDVSTLETYLGASVWHNNDEPTITNCKFVLAEEGTNVIS